MVLIGVCCPICDVYNMIPFDEEAFNSVPGQHFKCADCGYEDTMRIVKDETEG